MTFLSSSDSYRIKIGSDGRMQLNDISDTSQDEMQQPYFLCVAEENDLSSITRLTIDAFGTDTITLSDGIQGLERMILTPPVGIWNTYSDYVALTEILSGLRKRTRRQRMLPEQTADVSRPPVDKCSTTEECIAIAMESSLVLVLAREKVKNAKNGEESIEVDAIATVELQLQPTDGKIPFTQPWLDTLERRIAKFLGIQFGNGRQLQPYLSNLCVAPSARGKGLGRALVRCVECLSRDTWGYSKIYLHVDLENTSALNLYKSEGYRDVGFRWNPFWAGRAAIIGYFVKNL
eukprot:CAMPEP_0194415644 /NCGR_PEP_ID=MMETSP0176-20130528/14443_1 /TAXON_ID=216777 /ORGANISM="Proboscia alata, Strain PI-D3" /LENGTH=290 /DNA_ID=CAMNT_0039220415 /DNA_START=251 /DNA_END=1123 /DNA_ORIENTATION=-